MNDALLKAQQMGISVNFCSDEVQNLNKRISGRAGRRGSESGGRKPNMSMEKGTRHTPTSRTPPMICQGENWELGLEMEPLESLFSSIWILKTNLH